MAGPILKDRRILVTAGPTWVPLDAVRHFSNFSSGRTGLVIARVLARHGAAVTLLMGPGRCVPSARDRAALAVRGFVTFDDLQREVRSLVGSRCFAAMVHAAAVADYRPVEVLPGKLPSDEEEIVVRLRRTPKIVDEVRALDPAILLVKFKLEVGRTNEELLRIARASRERSDADLLVANDLARMRRGVHPAVILDREGVVARVETTAALAEALARAVAERTAPAPGAAGEESALGGRTAPW